MDECVGGMEGENWLPRLFLNFIMEGFCLEAQHLIHEIRKFVGQQGLIPLFGQKAG